jgi:hypothetical protein
MRPIDKWLHQAMGGRISVSALIVTPALTPSVVANSKLIKTMYLLMGSWDCRQTHQ